MKVRHEHITLWEHFKADLNFLEQFEICPTIIIYLLSAKDCATLVKNKLKK